MKRFSGVLAVAAALFALPVLMPALATAPALAADVGVSVTIGDPGFYGRLDLGRFPSPVLLYDRPVMIEPSPYYRPPVYLRVPPLHAREWGRYCVYYRACGEPVFFVDDDWYRREYAPRYREWYGHPGPGYYERHDDRHDRRYDRRDDRRDDRYDRRDDRYDHRGYGR